MKISIGIPTYNRPQFLKEALESCLHQTVKPFEIVIGDDSKTTDSEAVVNHYQLAFPDINIRYHREQKPLGQLANVKRIISLIEGDYFVLLHDDDLILPDALALMASTFKNDERVEVVFGKQYIVLENGAIDDTVTASLNKVFFRTEDYEGSVLSPLEVGITQQFPNDCYMIKSALAKRIEYGDKKDVGNAGDFDFGLRLGLANSKFYFINEFTAKYRLSSSSVARDGTDSGYQAYKLIEKLDYSPTKVDYKTLSLKRKAPIAIVQALKFGKRKDAFRIYFSKYHLKRILTSGGIKRFLLLFLPNYLLSKI